MLFYDPAAQDWPLGATLARREVSPDEVERREPGLGEVVGRSESQ